MWSSQSSITIQLRVALDHGMRVLVVAFETHRAIDDRSSPGPI
jgi:hypothetical protein